MGEEWEGSALETGTGKEMGEGCTLGMGTPTLTQGHWALYCDSTVRVKEGGWPQVTGTGTRRQKVWDLGMSTSGERAENWPQGMGRAGGREKGCVWETGWGSF